MTVLQLAKSMRPNTGGVSTHIIGLSLELTRRGHTVIVASAGGEYARDLDRHHIDHVTIPFDRAKNPLHALTSLWRLARIVRVRRVDIIHCHWRITTIYARVLSAFLSVTFVWSNHSVNIPSRFPYRLFTFPGKAAIAVSSDSHEFL